MVLESLKGMQYPANSIKRLKSIHDSRSPKIGSDFAIGCKEGRGAHIGFLAFGEASPMHSSLWWSLQSASAQAWLQ